MKFFFQCERTANTPCYVGLLCHHFDNKSYLTNVNDSMSVSFFVERKLECIKVHGPSEMVAQFYAAPHFQVHKMVCPHPICTSQPPHPVINDWSLSRATGPSGRSVGF